MLDYREVGRLSSGRVFSLEPTVFPRSSVLEVALLAEQRARERDESSSGISLYVSRRFTAIMD